MVERRVKTTAPRLFTDMLVVKGAREHNLSVDELRIPKNQLVVFTGVSGSGKSSLAFQAAASASRRSVSDFVLESALVRADETLTNRTRFGLDADQWKAFLAALDAPPRELPRMKRLFQEPSVFEGGKVL